MYRQAAYHQLITLDLVHVFKSIDVYCVCYLMFVLMLSVCSVYKKINILMSFLNIEDTTKLYCKKNINISKYSMHGM